MAQDERIICRAEALREGGQGVKFSAAAAQGEVAGFAVRYEGVVRAYVNRCAHVGVELDWGAPNFFDISGLYLVCSTHGALYDPRDGRCMGGPCAGRGLEPLPVVERDGSVILLQDWKPE